ncbi:MAG: T9SS C-terminal target domain-containing protein, partial [Bacteroidetes bacterium]
TNVAESNWQDLEVYPNPATRILYIQSPATPDAIRVFDLNGREVYRSESPRASYQLTIDNFEEGLYLIQVLFGNDLQTIKVIIQP